MSTSSEPQQLTRPPVACRRPTMQMRPNMSSKASFRASYYAKLGIFPQGSAAAPTTRQGSPPAVKAPPTRPTRSPPCLRRKRSVLHTTPARDQRVSFHPEVRLYRIKHHEDYSDEEWNNCWVDSVTLDYEKDRNTFEFSADGADWENATEEENFMTAPDGSLIHPASWFAYREHWEKNGPAAPLPVDFRALLEQPLSRRWSPPPVTQRKTFWLFELAMESVQKGKQAIGNSRKQQHHQASLGQTVNYRIRPRRKSDRGWP